MNQLLYAKDDNYSKDDSMEKYIEIDLRKHIPIDTYVSLKNNFRKKLFLQAKENMGTRQNIVDKLKNVKYVSVYEWENNRAKPTLENLLRIAEMAKIPAEEVWKNINYLTSSFEMGKIRPKSFKIKFDTELSEWFGILLGDGCLSYKYIDCTNTCHQIALFFVKTAEKIFGLHKEQTVIYVRFKNRNEEVERTIENLNKIGYKRVVFEYSEKAKNIHIKARANVKVIAKIIESLLNDLYKIVESSDKNVKRAFIRGFYSSEGSFSERRISLSNTNMQKMKFIRKLLIELGFERLSKIHIYKSKKFNRKRDLTLYISSKHELEKFNNEIGFGKHTKRNQKLRDVIKSIDKEFKKYPEWIKLVYNLIEREGEITSFSLSKEYNISVRNACSILQRMKDENLISIINSESLSVYRR